MLGRKRRMREFFREFERPVVVVAGKGDQPSYEGVLHDVLDDAVILARAVLLDPAKGGTVGRTPVDGMILVERSKIAHVQLLNGMPG